METQTRPRRRQVVARVREAIWAMKDPQDMGDLLSEIRSGMVDLGIPLLYCGVNLVEPQTRPPSVVSHSMNPQGQWRRLHSKGSQTVLGFWQEGEVVYRRDLTHNDPYGEGAIFPHVGCIIDVPFSQGTLAASSRQPNAFSDADLELLQDMAQLLTDGFRRLDELKVMAARLQLREQVWQMHRAEDIVQVLVTLRDCFDTLGLTYTGCGLNLIRESGSFVTHSLERGSDWVESPVAGPHPVIEQFWREKRIVYRRDLQQQDRLGEMRWMAELFETPVRCVIDVPFSHGTLALNHTEPDAFSDEQVELLQGLADILEEGFRRMDDLQALAQRNQALEQALEEKVVLLKEVHHRVKNNLQVIPSLLSLRTGTIDDPTALRSLEDTQSQVQSMALVHERLYETEDLARLDCAKYLQALAEDVFSSHGVDPQRIQLDAAVASHSVSVDTAIHCGLIVQELISNALRHAFPDGRRGTVRVESGPLPNDVGRLRVCDDGVGLPVHFDPRTADTLGLRLVGDLARQMNSTIEVGREGGTSFQVQYPMDSKGE
ncbi:MAG TPA: histidine kinase dimerization/phosphoacceptor domain -containing protein [Candidatus Latescibacteria bacterium]|nr:histidine kinase dimerization/phosphoacceptor domain -containing protein [Candidatus Latescibacterota bacterium]HJP33533.1 histidine kinase dimerization/phosphoacceptor domain -containing protein [Candidatus Latescibacterota bacterium]